MTATHLEVSHVTKHFGGVGAVADVSLIVERGEFVSILGPSGCGKTTLLRVIAGFETPDDGAVLLEGRDITRLPPNRRPTSMVFQRGALFPHRTVAENVAYPLKRRGVPRAEAAAKVEEMLALVQLHGLGDRLPSQISGGQAQRVALARALAAEPSVLLLDEPLSALDLKLRKEMQLELRRLHRVVGTTFMFVTHDQEEALVMSDRIVVMNAGCVMQIGTPREVYEAPANAFVSMFIGESNVFRATVLKHEHGTVRLSAGGVELLAAGNGVRADAQSVIVSVRPEHIRLGLRRLNQAEWTELDATIEEVIFAGNSVRVRVSSRLGHDLWIEQRAHEMPSSESEGTAAIVAWRALDARVISGNDDLE